MVTIADSTLRQNVYETLYDQILALNLLSSTVTVTAAYIDDTSAFPQVVISPVDVLQSNRTYGVGYFDKDIRILIDIYTKKNKDKDIIADAIVHSLNTTSYSGITLVGTDESNAYETPNSNGIHLKSITVSFMRKG